MIIKRYTGATWEELYPKTLVSRLYAGDASTTLFDGNSKLKMQYLPDAVFDSLYYAGAITPATSDLKTIADTLINTTAPGIGRSPKGMYYVSSEGGTLTANTTAAVVNTKYYKTIINVSDNSVGQTVAMLEAGDWFICDGVTGTGTVEDPYVVSFAVVNNTYELAGTAFPGIVKIFSDTLQDVAANAVSAASSRTYGIQKNSSGQMVVNVPWENTVYAHPAYTARAIDTTGVDVLDTFSSDGTGHVTGIAKRTLPDATTAAAGVMSAADKTKLDGIATGANNYSHPNHTGDVTSVADGATTITANAVTGAKFRQSAALSIVGNGTNAAANVTDLTAGTDGHVLRRSGTALGFGTISTDSFSNYSVTNTKLASVATNTIKGRVTALAGVVEDLTGAQVRAITQTIETYIQSGTPTSPSANAIWYHI